MLLRFQVSMIILYLAVLRCDCISLEFVASQWLEGNKNVYIYQHQYIKIFGSIRYLRHKATNFTSIFARSPFILALKVANQPMLSMLWQKFERICCAHSPFTSAKEADTSQDEKHFGAKAREFEAQFIKSPICRFQAHLFRLV